MYDTRTGATVATYQLADPANTIVNDVAVARHGAWFRLLPGASATIADVTVPNVDGI